MSKMTEKSKLFLNRELSLLKFNERVLWQAEDKRSPVLEKIRFMEIFFSNMDEFFMKRVGSLKRYTLSPSAPLLIDGATAKRQLELIHKKALELNGRAFDLLRQALLPQLSKEGIRLLSFKDLSKSQKDWAGGFFKNKMFPILTPLAVDHNHPFPLISALSLSLAVKLFAKKSGAPLFARIKAPGFFAGWIPLPSAHPKQNLFLSSSDLLIKHLQSLFPKMEIAGFMPFRITRNIDIESAAGEEEGAEDLLEFIEEEIQKRKFAKIVRLEHGPDPDPWLLSFLKRELRLRDQDVYELSLPLDFIFLRPISRLKRPELKRPPFQAFVAAPWSEENLFDLIKRGDQLVHHPFESFSASVERFITQSAADPRVAAIKMTLYRTNERSSIVSALISAAKSGKQVVCVLELNARLEEEKNIEWAHKMEKAGVHVTYGLIGLKTHSKLALVIRKEGEDFKAYLHIGTGNYHAQTAKLYTDLSLFTCHKEIAQDAVELFHFLTGRSKKRSYKSLIVSPARMEKKFLKLIRREGELALEGKPAEIFVKVNNLEAPKIIKALYEASAKGVKIKLIVRGVSCLRPGLKGLSENIELKSIVGPFLEHSRIFFFRSGERDILNSRFFIGSADWMKRNLYSRVELVCPVYDKKAIRELWNLLSLLWKDESSSWRLGPQGSYLKPKEPARPSVHDRILENFKKTVKGLA